MYKSLNEERKINRKNISERVKYKNKKWNTSKKWNIRIKSEI